MEKEGYKLISFLDIDNLLRFEKRSMPTLAENQAEEKRIEKDLKGFISEVEKHTRYRIHFIGHEKGYGKHLIRFVADQGGFVEFLVEKPFGMNAYFTKESHAEKFLKGLREAMEKKIPPSSVKNMFIDTIRIEDSSLENTLSIDKWERIHRLTVKKTIVTTVVILLIYGIIKLIELFIGEFTKKLFNLSSTTLTSLIIAAVVALFFLKIKEKVDYFIGRFI